MAAFPTFDHSPRSQRVPDDGLKTYVTEGGGIRGRQQYAATVWFITLIIEDLDDTDSASIESHYTASPTGAHTVVFRGVTYDVTYRARPKEIEFRGTLRTWQVEFAGTEQ